MGRYQQKQENKSFSLIGLGLFAFMLAIIAGGWLYINEELSDALKKTETTVLPLPQSAEESGHLSTGSADDVPVQAAIPGSEKESPESAEPPEQSDSFVLPELDNSDEFFRDELLRIAPGLSPWLNTDNLIRKLLLIVNDFAQGSRLQKHMRHFKLAQPFAVVQESDGLYMAPESYRRYDPLAAAINALDVDAGLALYKKIRPLLLQVYSDFSYPESYGLEDLFKKAASEILAAPIHEKRLELVRPSVFYKFADPKLEALGPVRKQMLRMGPDNARIIQNKVRRLVEGLVNLDE